MRMMDMRMAQDEDKCDGDDVERLPVGQECHEAPCKHSKKPVHCADAMLMKLAAARLHHPSKEMLGVHDICHCMEGAPRNCIHNMLLGHDHPVRVSNALGPVLFSFLLLLFCMKSCS